MQKRLFSELGLSDPILKAVDKLGFEETSPIQSASIPVLMEGRDVVGQSQTGSGKTAAFAIPAIEKLEEKSRDVQVLILCPTRELAIQVAAEVHKLTAFKPKVHAVPIYGGTGYDRQFFELKKGPQIVIGTPGRIMDHMDRKSLDLSKVKMVILDECDRMLDMGFREDMEKILRVTPKERQTVFFSATLPPAIRDLIQQFGREPEHIQIKPTELTAPDIDQIYYEVPQRMKIDALTRLLDVGETHLGIIFCNTQRMVDDLADALVARGYSADRLHGGISQSQRTRTMEKFKKSGFDLLVATDVAGRGIDVDDLDLVVNFDLPYDAEDYVHRIGRTGRAGRKGRAITFVSGRDIYKLQFIERFTRTRIKRGRLPTANEVEQMRTNAVLDKVRATLEKGKFIRHDDFVDTLLEEGHSATDIASAILHELFVHEGVGAPGEVREAPRDEVGGPPRRGPEDRREPREQRESRPAPAGDRRDDEGAEGRPPQGGEQRPSGFVPLPPPAKGFQWIRLNLGEDDNFSPRDLMDAILSDESYPKHAIGQIKTQPNQTFAQIAKEHVEEIVADLDGADYGGRPVKCGFAAVGRPQRHFRGKKPFYGKPRPPRDG